MAEFKNKVVYQIYPKSFYDTDGDGIGDLKGVTAKLDYLKTLGVDYIWLTPFFVSPQCDNGYDVADYCAVDPAFGTMQDVEELIAQGKRRGIGLMLDMVFNHTSTEHRWFRKALEGDPVYQDYYIFRDGEPDTPPTNWVSKFGGSAWEYVPRIKKWYLHLFAVGQADLNWENPAVREELKNVIRFWKEKGVSGFRFDVVNLISKPEVLEDDLHGDGRRFYTDGHHVHAFLKELVADTGIDEMVTVGEMSSTSLENCVRYTNPAERELSMCFSFHHLKVDYRDGDKWELMPPDLGRLGEIFRHWQEGMQAENGWNAVFWCNHDQPRAVSRFGDDRSYRVESAKMLATCIHLMRGTPYIYQGEEIGMTNAGFTSISQYRDVESLNYYQILREKGKSEDQALEVLAQRSRDNGRTPMQWDDTANGGFTTAEPWIEPNANYPAINAKRAMEEEDSVFAYYQKLIRLRKELPVIAQGSIQFLDTGDERVIGYRRFDGAGELLVLCSFSGETVELALPESFREAAVVLGNYPPAPRYNGTVCLRPYECMVMKQ